MSLFYLFLKFVTKLLRKSLGRTSLQGCKVLLQGHFLKSIRQISLAYFCFVEEIPRVISQEKQTPGMPVDVLRLAMILKSCYM